MLCYGALFTVRGQINVFLTQKPGPSAFTQQGAEF